MGLAVGTANVLVNGNIIEGSRKTACWLGESYASGAPTPRPRIPAVVQTGSHFDFRLSHSVIERVRKSLKEQPMDVLVNHRSGFRHCLDQSKHRSEGALEFGSQTFSLGIVPEVRLLYVCARSRRERERTAQGFGFRRRVWTSSQATVACSSGSSSRRSSSAWCQSGTGTLSAEAARLSQIFSTNRRRSSTERSRISLSKADRDILSKLARGVDQNKSG